jgi:hypothetical protein
MMIRENQMLRQRIRELGEHILSHWPRTLLLTDPEERQVTDLTANSSITHEPATSSNLTRATSVSEEARPDLRAVATASEDAKDE